MTEPWDVLPSGDLDELADARARVETERMLRDPGRWPLRVLPVKRQRGGRLETGWVEQGVRANSSRGALPEVNMDGATLGYASVEEIVNDGWRVD